MEVPAKMPTDFQQVQELLSVQRFVAGLQKALDENDQLKLHPLMQEALHNKLPCAQNPSSTTFANPEGGDESSILLSQDALACYLRACTACLVYEPFLHTLLHHLRAFLLDLVARLTDRNSVLYLIDEPRATSTSSSNNNNNNNRKNNKNNKRNTAKLRFTLCSDFVRRNELIVDTFSRLLPLAPNVQSLAMHYFKQSPAFFDYATRYSASSSTRGGQVDLDRLLGIARTALRLLRWDAQALDALWNWSVFFPLCFHNNDQIKWYAARATAILLKLSNAQRVEFLSQLGVGEANQNVNELDTKEFLYESTQQQIKVDMLCTQSDNAATDSTHKPDSSTMPLHETLRSIFGVLIPNTGKRQAGALGEVTDKPSLVLTESTKRNLQQLAIALALKRPILVSGAGGSGKTATIRELAVLSGNPELVELHLDDQIDSKTLLGTYVCTDIPGEFTWQPGALTTAILEGRWVVIEDIDRAPFEILAALMPLLETREMLLAGRGETLVAHENFQIFATTTSDSMPKGFQESVWSIMKLESLDDAQIRQVLEQKFPKLSSNVVDLIMETFQVVSGCGSLAGNASSEALRQHGAWVWKETRRNYGRDFCLRDLLKWCHRISCFGSVASTNASVVHGDHSRDLNLTRTVTFVTEHERLRIVTEALDVFCGGIREPSTRLEAAKAIASLWNLQEEQITHEVKHRRPHINVTLHEMEIGRVHLPTLHDSSASASSTSAEKAKSFVLTGHSLRLMEQLAAIVFTGEPALLVGETGCGKTSIIQHLAHCLGQKLVVQNLNIQSDSSDLVGGFKPVEIHLLARPVYMQFVELFSTTFSQKSNASFLQLVRAAFESKNWSKMLKGMHKANQMANNKLDKSTSGEPDKIVDGGNSPSHLRLEWEQFERILTRFERQKEQVETSFAFAFVEGALVKALRDGHWVLLDEINLASSETLERIATLLETHEKCAFSLTERGDVEIIKPHPSFRLFGAMNPSTDVGKKDLPLALRNRFTEIFVDEPLESNDLQMIVSHQFHRNGANDGQVPVQAIVEFYLHARQLATTKLFDGARLQPRFSLRTLCQALEIAQLLVQKGFGMDRSVYEGFCSCFCTQLEEESRVFMEKQIKSTFAKKLKAKQLQKPTTKPKAGQDEYVLVSCYWLPRGIDEELPLLAASDTDKGARKQFVVTKTVEANLKHLARAALLSKYPVLLQGPTSAGKTSLIQFLASQIGQKCVRINNHEHTDLQEYLGSYVSDSNGRLVFQEGILVQALRKGWWIILDELNLAPSEILEALNRVLDDNRELYLAETQEIIKPHKQFLLFATQNPPGLYGGRKVLSRAFRNRFMEVQMDPLPSNELLQILEEKSFLPRSFCEKLIEIFQDFQRIRQQSSLFAGKHGSFMTTRDLLRWANRMPMTKQQLAEEGYCLLAERLRKDSEKLVVKQVLEKHIKVVLDEDTMYHGKQRSRKDMALCQVINDKGELESAKQWGTWDQFEKVQQQIDEAATCDATSESAKSAARGLQQISVTKSLRRLFTLVGKCLQYQEPVLLVGETGCGKTTVCQLFALLFEQQLHVINCHQHTETSDFLGCLRPVRGKEQIAHKLEQKLRSVLMEVADEQDQNHLASASLHSLLESFDAVKQQILEDMAAEVEEIELLKFRLASLFEWVDGPLIESMKQGDLLLIDEVNLAEDAVLERLNSVLEPSRTILLAEKASGKGQVEEIVASPKWRVMATMNPGGDFGKRELSPALRNRFTEIWVPAITDLEDIGTIIRDRLVGKASSQTAVPRPLEPLCDPMLKFVKQFNEANGHASGCGTVTLRDVLSWIHFIRSVTKSSDANDASCLSSWVAFVQGAALSVLDGLGLGSDKALETAQKARKDAYEMLLNLVTEEAARQEARNSLFVMQMAERANDSDQEKADPNQFCISQLNKESQFGIEPFFIDQGSLAVSTSQVNFSLKAPTTLSNVFRVLRAMQVNRPILLEGSPGVGKTSLINAIAKASGNRLVRINLSEQTDISDLFGSDLPAPSSTEKDNDGDDQANSKTTGAKAGAFEWCDGVFLRALKNGDWVLLDELNLASQSVLEGLNSCLDHRSKVYIPEIDQEFDCPKSFRVFAAQNPLCQGGGRKGLPKSFLNRFTRVFVETLRPNDLMHIASCLYPAFDDQEITVKGKSTSLLVQMVRFNSAIHHDTMVSCAYGRSGAPWEFNLRDVFRLCDLLEQSKSDNVMLPVEDHADGIQTQDQVLEVLLFKLRYFVNFIYVERMRTHEDRKQIAKRFEEFFGMDLIPFVNKSFDMSPTTLRVGLAKLPRNTSQNALEHMALGRMPPMLGFLLQPMEALVHCVNLNWPALLVGPAASGKTCCVRLLAALSGNKLHEMAMSAGTDATELLGCFEQADLGRKLREIKQDLAQQVHQTMRRLALHISTLKTPTGNEAHACFRTVGQTWQALAAHEQSTKQQHQHGKPRPTKNELDDTFMGLLRQLVTLVTKAQGVLENAGVTLADMSAAVSDNDGLRSFSDRLDEVQALSEQKSISSCFEWVDGTLIEAMIKGEWCLFDNVNFCSSSVLDRLNSLMETGGELLVNECGVINGKLRVIKPHPNFRLFLAMDAQYGEVSRAMRNRCVEIGFAHQDGQQGIDEQTTDELALHKLVEATVSDQFDLITLVNHANLPGLEIPNALRVIHQQVTSLQANGHRLLMGHRWFNRRHLQNWACFACAEIQRGVPALHAFRQSFAWVYGQQVLEAMDTQLAEALDGAVERVKHSRGCPLPIVHKTFDLSQSTETVLLRMEMAYLEYLLYCISVQVHDALTSPTTQVKRVLLAFLKNKWSCSCNSENIHAVDEQDMWQLMIEDTSGSRLVPCEHIVSAASQIMASISKHQQTSGATWGNGSLAWNLIPFALCRVVSGASGAHSREMIRITFDKLVAKHCNSFGEMEVRQLRAFLEFLMDKQQESFTQRIAGGVDLMHHSMAMQWLERFQESRLLEAVDARFGVGVSTEASGKTKTKKAKRAKPGIDEQAIKSLCLLQQSYALNQYHVDRSNIEAFEIVLLLYPLIKSFDEFVKAFASQLTALPLHTRASLMSKVMQLGQHRMEFGQQLVLHNAFDVMSFVCHWKWFQKAIFQFFKHVEAADPACVSPRHAIHSLHNVLQDNLLRVQDALEDTIGCVAKKAILWKHAGHPLLPICAQDWQLLFDFYQLETQTMQPLRVSSSSSSSALAPSRIDVFGLLFGTLQSEQSIRSGALDIASCLYVDGSVRQEMVEALAHIACVLRQDKKNHENSIGQEGTLPPSLRDFFGQLPKLLHQQLADKKRLTTDAITGQLLYLSELQDEDDDMNNSENDGIRAAGQPTARIGKDVPIILFDNERLLHQLVDFQLEPLSQLAFVKHELQVVVLLLQFLNDMSMNSMNSMNADSCKSRVQPEVSNVLPHVEKLLDMFLRLRNREPTSFYAYQDVVWRLRLLNDAQTIDRDLLSSQLNSLRSHMMTILLEFHRFLHNNLFATIEAIALEVFSVSKKKVKDQSSQSATRHAGDAIFTGLALLLKNHWNGLILRLISEVDLTKSHCPTVEAPLRVLRLEKAQKFLMEISRKESTGNEVTCWLDKMVVQVFSQSILAFESTFEARVWPEICELLSVLQHQHKFSASQQVQQLMSLLHRSNDLTFVASLDRIVSVLMEEFSGAAPKKQQQTTPQISHSTDWFSLGKRYFLLGLWRFWLLLPSSPVDPVLKPRIKQQKLIQRLAHGQAQNVVVFGSNLLHSQPITQCSNDLNTLHSQLMQWSSQAQALTRFASERYTSSRVDNQDEQMVKLDGRVFGELFRETWQFEKTILPLQKMLGLVRTMEQLTHDWQRKSSTGRKQKQSLSEMESLWQRQLFELQMLAHTCESFLSQMRRKYASFKDVCDPLGAALYMVCEGLGFFREFVSRRVADCQQQQAEIQQQTQRVALQLAQYPQVRVGASNPLSVRDLFVEDKGSALRAICSHVNQTQESVGMKVREMDFVQLALVQLDLDVRDELVAWHHQLPTAQLNAFYAQSKQLFDACMRLWEDQKAREEQKRLEEEQAFQYKTKTLELETEEEILEKEYREQFPDYTASDFGLTDTPGHAVVNSPPALSESLSSSLVVSDQLIHLLCEVHARFFALNATLKSTVAAKERLGAFTKAFSMAVGMRHILAQIDCATLQWNSILSSSFLASSFVQQQLQLGAAASTVGPTAPVVATSALTKDYMHGIDFHRDPFVQEMILVVYPIQQLLKKLQELLLQWPDHAVLQQLVLICERIRQFELASPLARTLGGIELLLRKAQDWEAYAAKQYSISKQLLPLSSLVTRWRKLELYSWPHLLTVKDQSHRRAAQKGWFHLYSLLTGEFESNVAESNASSPKELGWLHLNEVTKWLFVIEPPATAAKKSNLHDGKQASKNEFLGKLFATCDEYLRSCTMGQFETRLDMMYAFCAQFFTEVALMQLQRNSGESTRNNTALQTKMRVANALYHLVRFYRQHERHVATKWSDLKKPIQKKLEEFVKICKWDEQTYYSLAESAEKSHRKLMKYVRAYEDDVLNLQMQPTIDEAVDHGVSKDPFGGFAATKRALQELGDEVSIVPENNCHEPEEEQEEEEEEGQQQEPKEKAANDGDVPLYPIVVAKRVVMDTPWVTMQSHLESLVLPLQSSSVYVTKTPDFTKKMMKFIHKKLLLTPQIALRQKSSEICEGLCETIFYRMNLLRDQSAKLPKNAKQKALLDLLQELQVQGLSYLRGHLPPQQLEMHEMFELDVPQVENCLHIDAIETEAEVETPSMKTASKKSKRAKSKNKRVKSSVSEQVEDPVVDEPLERNSPLWLWHRADTYYYRFATQLSSLRFASTTSFSHDLSAVQVDKMMGFAENMLFTILQQRQLLHAMSISHQTLVKSMEDAKLLCKWQQEQNPPSKEGSDVPGWAGMSPSMVALARQWHGQQHDLIHLLRRPLSEFRLLMQHAKTGSGSRDSRANLDTISKHFRLLFELLTQLEAKLHSNRGLRNEVGVPSFPKWTVTGSEGARLHGISPVVVCKSNAINAFEQLPSPHTLATTSKTLAQMLQLIRQICHAAQGTILPVNGLQTFMNQLVPCFQAEAMSYEEYQKLLAQEQAMGKPMKNDLGSTSTWLQVPGVKEFMHVTLQKFDQTMESMIVSIQELCKLQEANQVGSSPSDAKDPADDKPSEEEDGFTIHSHGQFLMQFAKQSRVNQIVDHMTTFLDHLQTASKQIADQSDPNCQNAWMHAFQVALGLMSQLVLPNLEQVRGLNRQLMVDLLVCHKSLLKMDYVLVRVFRQLFVHGFCRSDDAKDEQGEGDPSKTRFEDDVDGTGMGEGEGKKDVSDQIEDEEQLLGLKGDQPDQQEPKQQEQPEDTGLEMENDFDGEMYDLPEDQQQEDQDDDKEDDEQEEELDREMGDLDQNEENVVDEKMWGDDSDDEEDAIDKEKEKFEENAPMDSKPIEDEMRTKDDDDDENADKGNDPKTKQEEEDQSAPDKEDDHGGDDDDDGEDMKEHEVNDDLEEKYEEQHDNVDPNQDESHEEEQRADEDALPEDMQLDREDDGDDGEEGEGEEEVEDAMDDNEQPEADGEGQETHEQDEDGDENEQQEDDVDMSEEKAVQMGGGGLEDENEDHAEQEEEEEEEEAKEEEQAQDAMEPQQKQQASAGNQSRNGQDEIHQDQEDQPEHKEEPSPDAASSMQQEDSEENPDMHQGADLNERGVMQQQQNSNEKPQLQKPVEKQQPQAPNPYENADKTREHWQKRVELFEKQQDQQDQPPQQEQAKQEENQDMQMGQRVEDDDEDADMALAPTEDNQMLNPNSTNPDETEDHDDSVQPEEDNENVLMEQDPEMESVEPPNEQDDQVRDAASNETSDKTRQTTQQEDHMVPEDEQDVKMKDGPVEQDDDDAHATDDDDDEDETKKEKENRTVTNLLQPDVMGSESETRHEDALLTQEQVTNLRHELDELLSKWNTADPNKKELGDQVWSRFSTLVANSSQRLCEQLRLILEPTLCTKMAGDFRTGKRINMRKVISYVASDFRKDKIWLRRTKPSKRQYQIMLAIDDSKSMAENLAGEFALEALAMICKSLVQLEIGEFAVARFGQQMDLVHGFEMPFTDANGARIMSEFTFDQDKTNMLQTLEMTSALLDQAAMRQSSASHSKQQLTQIVFILSDGRFDSDKRGQMEQIIQKCLAKQQLIVLMVLDANADKGSSILDTKTVQFDAKGKIQMVPYLDKYPFPFYVLLQDVKLLPEILSDSLRQWFELLSSQN